MTDIISKRPLLKRFIVIFLLLNLLPVNTSTSLNASAMQVALGPIVIQVLKVGIQSFLLEAAKQGIDKAGKYIFRDSWGYAKHPVLKVVETVGELIPNFLSNTETEDTRVQQAREASSYLENDHNLKKFVRDNFTTLDNSEFNAILLALTQSVSDKMDEALQNQARLLRNQIQLHQNQIIMMDMLSVLTNSRNKIVEGVSHFRDSDEVIEFDYPTELGPPKKFVSENRYGYLLGNSNLAGIEGEQKSFWENLISFSESYYLMIIIMDFERDSDNKNERKNPIETYNLWKKFLEDSKKDLDSKGFEIEDEKIDPYLVPERKYFAVFKNQWDSRVIRFFKFGSKHNYLIVAGAFDKDTWKEHQHKIKTSVYESIQWSPFNAEKYFRAFD
jgi:hypothetical protein